MTFSSDKSKHISAKTTMLFIYLWCLTLSKYNWLYYFNILKKHTNFHSFLIQFLKFLTCAFKVLLFYLIDRLLVLYFLNCCTYSNETCLVTELAKKQHKKVAKKPTKQPSLPLYKKEWKLVQKITKRTLLMNTNTTISC